MGKVSPHVLMPIWLISTIHSSHVIFIQPLNFSSTYDFLTYPWFISPLILRWMIRLDHVITSICEKSMFMSTCHMWTGSRCTVCSALAVERVGVPPRTGASALRAAKENAGSLRLWVGNGYLIMHFPRSVCPWLVRSFTPLYGTIPNVSLSGKFDFKFCPKAFFGLLCRSWWLRVDYYACRTRGDEERIGREKRFFVTWVGRRHRSLHLDRS